MLTSQEAFVTFLWAGASHCEDVEGIMTLTFGLVESALQLVPEQIQAHTQIKEYSKRRQKLPREVLLDRGFHNAAMQKLARAHYKIPVERMGRPDIVHTTLLQVLETPLNWEGNLRAFVHTQEDYVISVNSKVRLPKNYVRFVGLIEQLFAEGQVPSKGEALLKIERMTLMQLVRRLGPTKVLGLSAIGKPLPLREVAQYASRFEDPMMFVGGFPRGHFTDQTRKLASEVFKVDKRSLDAWVVAGRFVYDFELAIGLDKTGLENE
jgi:rRNA small subunit pseudouridine methyltransferase Nep1